VVAFDHEMHRVGGAANVAHNAAALGASVRLAAAVAHDEAGDRLKTICEELGIRAALVRDPGRQTTTKVRVTTERNQQVARVDYETDRPLDARIEALVVDEVRAAVAVAGAVIVSDYVKGAVTEALMTAVVSAATERGIPVLVDPKIPHLELYRGATVVTPNHHEAAAATHCRVQTHAEARDVARRFRERTQFDSVLMTRGDQGMWLLAAGVEGHLPAAAREVADVTGAGDTVIAAFGLAMAAGASAAEAAQIANEAAGIVVGKFGPAVVTPEELLRALGA
jgi:D-beta-D-heptose 7-phosphate kinase/D-beta-D-heptose 1-phosphate adenosyltransferase